MTEEGSAMNEGKSASPDEGRPTQADPPTPADAPTQADPPTPADAPTQADPPTPADAPTQTHPSATAPPLLEARGVSKYFGSVNALEDISLAVNAGEVACVLGDNGAGKSTLIKILSGVHQPDSGELLLEGEPVHFTGPREARARGIATVFQDLATVPLMSVWRNFFLGNEPTRGHGPFQRLDAKQAQRVMREELSKMGIDVRDPNQTVGTLSGGERQAVAIARAVYFGAKVLILDEPTSALGVRQSGIVLKYIIQARSLGRGVIFITHNPHHAYPVGDRFVLLKRGRMMGSFPKTGTSLEQLTAMMAGGAELEQLSHELEGLGTEPGVAEVAKELAAEVQSTT
jgi:simple sugar transport system ATP-binding protein